MLRAESKRIAAWSDPLCSEHRIFRESAPLFRSAPGSTITGPPTAPLAQLAEQLTLNQREPTENLEEFANSHQRAAPRAAVDVDASATHVDASANPVSARIVEAWPFLPPHVRDSITLLVDAALYAYMPERGER